ncbi:COG3904 family protein [Sphingopyxis macrogoltabida]|uniref:Uncharacterized protein n=1 Tax=Sphingopyxis macrogoltabida TaxID=33050 RepID=A0AAC8Z1C1_SPHMC|nr:hypothetical protein [Sphingopyxis macrogoltabida]ALJ12512.1 hypothetical protein LH19_06500 [Sphingopyxis macrogoltabida]AMU90011.1 hypothetical protein ATM17_13290 [Sphingopyxis macrogoltabida]
MTSRSKLFRLALSAFALVGLTAATDIDPANPTCPLNPNWSANPTMTLKVEKRGRMKVMLAEGRIDSGLPDRLSAALKANPDVEEIWLRSPGGDARAGNTAGRIIRSNPGILTRVPTGWTCFSACNFVFMGGLPRVIDPGGVFMVHMFTRTGDRSTIDMSVAMGTDATRELIGGIEQDSALLASEDNDFLIKMGVSRKLLTDVMYQQQAVATAEDRSTRRCLTLDEALKYGVTYAPE